MQLDLPVRTRATVGLTPLIDVVFILLLFFMLTTQFGRQQALPVSVATSDGSPSEQSPDTLRINLADDGTVSFMGGSVTGDAVSGDAVTGDAVSGDARIPASNIADHPAIQRAVDQSTPVLIVADDTVQLQTFTQLMDTLTTLGISNLSVNSLR